MTKLVCSSCGDELYSASPQIFSGDVHLDCGGKFEVEGVAELRSMINIQNLVMHYMGGEK